MVEVTKQVEVEKESTHLLDELKRHTCAYGKDWCSIGISIQIKNMCPSQGLRNQSAFSVSLFAVSFWQDIQGRWEGKVKSWHRKRCSGKIRAPWWHSEPYAGHASLGSGLTHGLIHSGRGSPLSHYVIIPHKHMYPQHVPCSQALKTFCQLLPV